MAGPVRDEKGRNVCEDHSFIHPYFLQDKDKILKADPLVGVKSKEIRKEKHFEGPSFNEESEFQFADPGVKVTFRESRKEQSSKDLTFNKEGEMPSTDPGARREIVKVEDSATSRKCNSFFIVILLTVCIILVSVFIKYYMPDSHEKTLREILPRSFSVEFSFQNQGIEEEQLVKIEWDLDAKDLRYSETDRNQEALLRDILAEDNLSHTLSDDPIMKITVVNKEAVLHIFDSLSEEWTWSCIPSLESLWFYHAVQFIQVATLAFKENMSDCEGNVWSNARHCGECMPLYFCEKDSRLISIRQNAMTAFVMQWTTPTTNTIQLPEGYVLSSCEFIRRQHEIESDQLRNFDARETENGRSDQSSNRPGIETDREQSDLSSNQPGTETVNGQSGQSSNEPEEESENGKSDQSCKHPTTETENKESGESNKSPTRETGSKDIPNKDAEKTCLFIHGAGEIGPKTGYAVKASLPEYWGKVESYVSSCVTKKFIHFDTVNRGWDDPELMKIFCSFATSPKDEGNITNKIIYSHSMGNLIIAAALHHKVCKFNETSKWYSLQGPWRGSRVADWLGNACRGDIDSVDGALSILLLLKFLEKLHYCTSAKFPSLAYRTLQTNYRSTSGTSFTDLINVGKKYVTGILCGYSSWGMGKRWFISTALWTIQLMTKLKHPNDGMVNYDFSCAMEISGYFSTTYKNRFYRTKANHAEGTCRYGDIQGNEYMSPCLWFNKN